MTGQQSDFGTISYVTDPSSPSGYKAVQSLDPADKALLDKQRGIQSSASDLTGKVLGNVDGTIGGAFSLDAARGKKLSDINQTFLDPQWEQQRASMESRLLNQGVRPGSEQYENQMRQFGQQRDDAYNKMFLDSFTMANNAALTERNLPLSDYSTLMGLNQPVNPQQPTVNTPTPGVSPTDVSGNINNAYNQQAAQSNAARGGLFGLMGTIGSAALSDVRMKRDIRAVGRLANGLMVYDFRYLGDERLHRGLMAQEVLAYRPEAVEVIDGLLHVNYGLAVL